MLGSLWFNSFSAGGAPGGAGDYELISTTVLGSSAASVTFSGLGTSAAAYKHLQIRMTGRGDSAVASISNRLRFNSATSTYADHYLDANGSSVTSGANTSGDTFLRLGRLPAASQSANIFGALIVDILDFASTSKNKTLKSLSGSAGYNYLTFYSGLWASTSAITDITILTESGNFATGSRFSIYGLK